MAYRDDPRHRVSIAFNRLEAAEQAHADAIIAAERAQEGCQRLMMRVRARDAQLAADAASARDALRRALHGHWARHGGDTGSARERMRIDAAISALDLAIARRSRSAPPIDLESAQARVQRAKHRRARYAARASAILERAAATVTAAERTLREAEDQLVLAREICERSARSPRG